jgi:tetratricopeptide (TPR) repeat protein
MQKTNVLLEIDELVAKECWDKVEAMCRDALCTFPSDLPLSLRLINAIAKQQRLEKAIEICEALCHTYPQDVRALHALLDLYISLERFLEAELACKNWLKDEGNNDFFVKMRLGRFLNRQGKGKESAEWWAMLYQAHSENIFIVEGYFDALALTNNYKQLEEICTTWLKSNKDDVTIKLKLARLLTNQKSFSKALRLWKELSEVESINTDIRVFHGLLDCFISLKNLNEAKLLCKEWQAKHPDEETINIRYARVLMQCGLYQDAESLLLTIQSKKDRRVYLFLTECYLVLDNIEKLKSITHNWSETFPEDVEPKLQHVKALLILGETGAANVLIDSLEKEKHSFTESQSRLFVGSLLLSERLDAAKSIIFTALAKAEVGRDWIRLLVQYAQHSRNASLSSLARALDILTFSGLNTAKAIKSVGILKSKGLVDFEALSLLLAAAHSKNSNNNEILNVFYSILARCQLSANTVTSCLKLFNKKTKNTNRYPALYFDTCFNNSYRTEQTLEPITTGVDITFDGKRSSEKVVIALNGIGGGFGGFPLELLDNYFKKRNITFVVLDDVTTRFYLSGVKSLGERFQNVVDHLANEFKSHEFYFIGKSAGSLAAMHFAKALNAKSVICFGAAVNCSMAFFERENDYRARPVVRRLNRLVPSDLLDIKPFLDKSTSFKTFLWYGDQNREDLVHAKYIEDSTNVHLRPIPSFKFHDALGGAVRANMLNSALTEFLM